MPVVSTKTVSLVSVAFAPINHPCHHVIQYFASCICCRISRAVGSVPASGTVCGLIDGDHSLWPARIGVNAVWYCFEMMKGGMRRHSGLSSRELSRLAIPVGRLARGTGDRRRSQPFAAFLDRLRHPNMPAPLTGTLIGIDSDGFDGHFCSGWLPDTIPQYIPNPKLGYKHRL